MEAQTEDELVVLNRLCLRAASNADVELVY